MSTSPLSSFASYDLHLHTVWSYDAIGDARCYFERARELKLRCLAITEHHNIDSVEENLAIAKEYPEIRYVIAAELTVTTSVGSIDLLCYRLPRFPEGLFKQVLDEYHAWQRAAGDARSRIMLKLGFPYDTSARLALLRRYRPERVIQVQGVTHVRNPTEASYFIEQGYFSSEEERVKSYAQSDIKIPPYPSVDRVVEGVKQAGGLVVIAHPPRYFLNDDLSRMDLLREECRLDGIECAHPSINPELSDFYRLYCKKHGLFSTGGSDTHGNEGDSPYVTKGRGGSLACHKGKDAWLDEFLERVDSR